MRWPGRSSSRFLLLISLGGCRSQPVASAAALPEGPEQCEARQREFVSFVGGLPERAVAGSVQVELPFSSLGAAPGIGPVFQISERAVEIDGSPLAGQELAERVRSFQQWLESWAPKRAPDSRARRPALYVAAARATEVRTLRAYLTNVPNTVELRLLVHTPAPSAAAAGAAPEARQLAEQLLREQEPSSRKALAARAYSAFSRCASLEQAVSSVAAEDARQRWPALRNALLAAAPRCACSELDTDSLKQVIVAEQRAGAAALGWLPLSFIVDERCGASMPLRSLSKLVSQIEHFDAEFSGGWQADALRFEEVLGNDRLLGYFCNALPGETLSAEQRARATLYWRLPGSDACQPWQFAPLSPGAPMGTWHRLGGPPLGFHYWQAAEEIRLFGPASSTPPSTPTDRRDWACEQSYRMVGVDPQSIELEHGRWFFSEAACRAAPLEAALPPGCVATLASEAPQ